MPPQLDQSAGTLRLRTYTDAWKIGTGLPSSLPPGEYAVTDRRLTPHGLIIEVIGGYKIRFPLPKHERLSDGPTSFDAAQHAMA
ncbi:MAG: hypothetical protein AAF907_01840 [Planctomycetota bacterium]